MKRNQPPPFANKFRRLAAMRRGEITCRIAQAIAKRFDRIHISQPAANLASTNSTTRFFFTPEELPTLVQIIRARIPAQVDEVISRADLICEHKFSLLGYKDLHYGLDIDWRLDIVNSKRSPKAAWHKIKYLDFSEVGDSKVTWELNRHQHLTTLAKAFLFTRNPSYLGELTEQWYDWQKKNPYPVGINWASALEVAFRSLSWLWIREFLALEESAKPFLLDLNRALGFNAWFINRYLSTYFSPNTHLLGEAVALFFIGNLCPEFTAAGQWREKGWRIILEHADMKVLSDGAYYEQSTYYHVYALDFFLHARILAANSCMEIPKHLDETILRMLTYLATLGQVAEPPRFGDDDGGRLFDGSRNRGGNLLDPLTIGAALFGRMEFKKPGVQVTEEMIWLLGAKGLAAYDALPHDNAIKSAGFRASGTYVLVSDSPYTQRVIVDAGPLGGENGGHGHADALSLTLAVDGENVLVDPGAYQYIGAGPERAEFRGTMAHNTVSINGLSQADAMGPFSWCGWPNVSVDKWISTKEFDFFSGAHDGYTRLGVMHQRAVFHRKSGFWLVVDTLSGAGIRNVDLRWHIAPECTIETDDNGVCIARNGARWNVALSNVSKAGQLSIEEYWHSPAYGAKEKAACVRMYAGQTELPAEFATLISVGGAAAIGTRPISLLPAQGAQVYDVSTGAKREWICFARASGGWQAQKLESDAEFLYMETEESGEPLQIILLEGSFVRHRGAVLFYSPSNVKRHQWFADGKATGNNL